MAKQITQGLAVGVLILNLIIPGVGTLVAGQTKAGVWQLVLSILGGLLSVVLIGIPIALAAWIWALVTSINVLKSAK
jgi:TM2 domain-containing membrane protein YozV